MISLNNSIEHINQEGTKYEPFTFLFLFPFSSLLLSEDGEVEVVDDDEEERLQENSKQKTD